TGWGSGRSPARWLPRTSRSRSARAPPCGDTRCPDDPATFLYPGSTAETWLRPGPSAPRYGSAPGRRSGGLTMSNDIGLRGISLICLPTREQDKAIEFYESLGFEKRTDTSFGNGYRWVEVYLPGGQTGIALAPPPGDDPIIGVQTGITLRTEDVEATH